jgi:ribosomal protein S18 acetylase RimI-like enzyme
MTIQIRAFSGQDLDPVISLLDRVMPVEAITAVRFARQVLLDANLRPEGAIVAHRDGAVVGFCLAIARQRLDEVPADAERGYITLIGVLPEHQRQGIGGRMLEAAEKHLREQGRKMVMVSSYGPGYFTPGVDVNAYPAGVRFFQKHGYAEVSRPVSMQASLWRLEVPEWVMERERELEGQGLRVEPYRYELTLPLLECARAEFGYDWERVARETALRIAAGEPADRLMVAHEGGEVVGFSHYENERFGPIGVAASQRGRGVGQVLMFRTLAAMRRRGFRAAWFLWSDDRTARRLYDSAGFVEVRRFVVLRKEL